MDEPWCCEIIESTGKGLGGCFYDEYMQAKDRGEALFFPWHADPRYRLPRGIPRDDWTKFEAEEAEKYSLDECQVAWMRQKFEKVAGSSEARFRQEFPGCERDAFLGNEDYVFSPHLLMELEHQVKEVEAGVDIDGKPTHGIVEGIAENKNFPEYSDAYYAALVRRVDSGPPQSAYVIGADPAEGLEHGDFSCAVVLDRITGMVVAMMKTHLDVDQFAAALIAVGRYYNNAWLVVERNNHGHAVIGRIRDEGYPNLWIERRGYMRRRQSAPQFGWSTTESSKSMAIEKVLYRLRKGQLYLPFREILEELKVFVYARDGGPNSKPKARATPGCHDDLVMALIIACGAAEDLGVTDPIEFDRMQVQHQPVPAIAGPCTWPGLMELVKLQHPDWWAENMIRQPDGVFRIGDELPDLWERVR